MRWVFSMIERLVDIGSYSCYSLARDWLYGVLRCIERRVRAHAYANWKGSGIFFSIIKNARAKLSDSWLRVGCNSVRTKVLATLTIRGEVWGVFKSQVVEVYFHTTGFEYVSKEVDGVLGAIQFLFGISSREVRCGGGRFDSKGSLLYCLSCHWWIGDTSSA